MRLQYIQQDPQQIPRLRLAAIMQGLQESLAQARLRLQSTRRRLQAATSAPMSAPGPGLGQGSPGPAGQPGAIAALGPTPPQQAQVRLDAVPGLLCAVAGAMPYQRSVIVGVSVSDCSAQGTH